MTRAEMEKIVSEARTKGEIPNLSKADLSKANLHKIYGLIEEQKKSVIFTEPQKENKTMTWQVTNTNNIANNNIDNISNGTIFSGSIYIPDNIQSCLKVVGGYVNLTNFNYYNVENAIVYNYTHIGKLEQV